MSEHGTWVYAVTSSGRTVPDGLTGVGGTALRTVSSAGLVAVVSAVDLAEYGEEPLRRNLEDLEWLEATARAHHTVIDAVAEAGPAVPMQLATLYRSDERVAAVLDQNRDDFQGVLERIRERIEWGVKIYLPGVEGEAAPAGSEGGSAGAGRSGTGRGSTGQGGADRGGADRGGSRPGAAYLQRRRSELSAREDARAAAAASAEEIHAELAALSAAARVHKPQHAQLTGRSEPMIFNGTYLVDEQRAGDFTAAADELAGRHPGVIVELTGPWPPYSFTFPEDEEAAVESAGI